VEQPPPSVYHQLGGHEPVAAVVDVFYRRVLADEALARSFACFDMEWMRRHLAAFLNFALGGTGEYHGRSMREAHAGLGITVQDYERAMAHLRASLAECCILAPLVDTMMARIAALQSAIVAK
jgi:hemoglobin